MNPRLATLLRTAAGGEPWWVRRRHVLGLLVLALVVAASSWVRIHKAFTDPNFDRQRPQGMLRSDPGLLYYFTQRIVDSGGLVPDDFTADPRVEYPNEVNLLEDFTICQEFLVAWLYRGFGGDLPLHAFAVIVMAVMASLTAVGVYGLGYEFTSRTRFAAAAAVLWALLPANYRTIGFILIREDFSVPWFALHLFLLARAARVQTRVSFAAAGVALLAALSSWHAMGFVVLIEAVCFLLWYLRTGDQPFATRGAWLLPAVVAVGSLLVPVLRSKGTVLSLPMLVVGTLLLLRLLERRRPLRPLLRVLAGVGILGVLAGVAAFLLKLKSSGLGDYSHVYALLWAKVRHLGQIPADPTRIPFEARLLWQGPFNTCPPPRLYHSLTVGVILLVPYLARVLPAWIGGRGSVVPVVAALFFGGGGLLVLSATGMRIHAVAPLLLATLGLSVPGWVRGESTAKEALLGAFAGVSLLVAFLVERTLILPGLVLPVVAANLWMRVETDTPFAMIRHLLKGGDHGLVGTVLVLALTLLGYGDASWEFSRFFRGSRISWYASPPQRQEEIARLVTWIAEHPEVVPPGAAVAADFTNSTAVLAHTGHPILLQPKYETREARRRCEEFFETVIRGTPGDVRAYLKRYGCHFLLIDRYTVWLGSRYYVGIPDDRSPPPRNSAIATFFSEDPLVLQGIPGFHLVYRSPVSLGLDMFRLYRVDW